MAGWGRSSIFKIPPTIDNNNKNNPPCVLLNYSWRTVCGRLGEKTMEWQTAKSHDFSFLISTFFSPVRPGRPHHHGPDRGGLQGGQVRQRLLHQRRAVIALYHVVLFLNSCKVERNHKSFMNIEQQLVFDITFNLICKI